MDTAFKSNVFSLDNLPHLESIHINYTESLRKPAIPIEIRWLAQLFAGVTSPHSFSRVSFTFGGAISRLHGIGLLTESGWGILDDALLNPQLVALRTVEAGVTWKTSDFHKYVAGMREGLPQTNARGLLTFGL